MEEFLIIEGVRQVSEVASPGAPVHAPQRAFDEARALSSFPDLPSARNIARSLGVSWAEVLALAHEPTSVQSQRLGRKTGARKNEDYLSAEHVAFVLRLVARRLGVTTLSLSEYSTERAVMLRDDRSRFLHGGQLILPNEEQIRTFAGSWEKALAAADLEVSRGRRGEALRQRRMRAPPLTDLMERFYAHYGVQPVCIDLVVFARGNGIPYPSMRNPSFNQALAEWKKRRREQGLPVPSAPPPPSERPDYTRDVGAALPGERRRGKRHEIETCIAWMCRYLDELPARSRATRRSYRDWARQHGAPAPRSFEKHGGFARVRSLAQERSREAHRAA
jgi:hypothetical protein